MNFVAHFEGTDGPSGSKYLLAAHFDSRPRAENDPDSTKRDRAIDGANDGASGVAVLMELGRLFVSDKPAVNVDLAFLDGEDWGKSGDLEDYFLGAKDMITRGIKNKYRFGILIDMVGDKDLKIFKEQFSDLYATKVTDLIWKTAAELGEKAFVDSVGYTVYDDHLTFMTIGIPMTDVIDFVYPYWHSTHDTPDKCSAQSLAIVGRVLSTIIYRLK